MTVKFRVNGEFTPRNEVLVYRPEEYSIDCYPRDIAATRGVLLNDILLEADDDGNITGLSGFFPHTSWLSAPLEFPEFVCRKIIVERLPDPGIYVRFNEGRLWKAHVDYKRKVICLGNPDAKGDAVCFYPGAVLVMKEGGPVALWLRDIEGIDEIESDV